MNSKFQVSSLEFQVPRRDLREGFNRPLATGCRCAAFSLIEIMVVMALLSLIVIALMAVFSSTQTAFRASVTQTDVLEGGRATIDLIAQDLKAMTYSGGTSNGPAPLSGYNAPYNSLFYFTNRDFVNFFATVNPVFLNTPNAYGLPLFQPLVGSADGAVRTNMVQSFFVLSRNNVGGHDRWIGTGYAVNATNVDSPLYRFSMEVNAESGPDALFNSYMAGVYTNGFAGPGWSHLIDGVVDLRVRAFDANGYWITNSTYYDGNPNVYATNVNTYNNISRYSPRVPMFLGEANVYMFSNTVPAAVEVQMGVLEDRIRQRAESILNINARSNYLAQQAGAVHLFRQRVTIPDFQPAVN